MNRMTYIHTYIVIYEVLCFDVAQGRMNGAPNETRVGLLVKLANRYTTKGALIHTYE